METLIRLGVDSMQGHYLGGGVEPCGTACPGVFAGENSEIAETLC